MTNTIEIGAIYVCAEWSFVPLTHAMIIEVPDHLINFPLAPDNDYHIYSYNDEFSYYTVKMYNRSQEGSVEFKLPSDIVDKAMLRRDTDKNIELIWLE